MQFTESSENRGTDIMLKVVKCNIRDTKNIFYSSPHFSDRRNHCSSRNTKNNTRKYNKQLNGREKTEL